MTPVAPSILPSHARPVPLRARADLVCRQMQFQGSKCWLVKDPVSLAYHRLSPVQQAALQLLDGAASLEQIAGRLRRQFPELNFTSDDLSRLIADLHASRLVVCTRPGRAEYAHAPEKGWFGQALWRFMQNPLYVRLPALHPGRLLDWLEPVVGWALSPWGVALGLLLILDCWVLAASDAARIARELPDFQQFFSWPNAAALWLTLGAAKICHEFGHALACRRMGGECHGIGLSFMALCPCLYCDVSDSWMLPEKWRRMAIGAAGMYVELVISSLALVAWRTTQPGQIHDLALNVFLVTSLTTILFNANPLLQFDGYYMLSDLLEIPNLRGRAEQALRQVLARLMLGVSLPADPFMPRRNRLWLMLYAGCAFAYRWAILLSIVLVAHRLLKPYELATLGLLLGLVPCLAAAAYAAARFVKFVSLPQVQPMSRMRLLTTISALGLLGAAALMLPLPARLELPFVVEPGDARHVYATTPGILAAIAARPGDRVEKGQLLCELANAQQQDQWLRLTTLRKSLAIDLAVQRKLQSAAGIRIAGELLARLDEQLADFERRMKRFRIVAPCAGVVIDPEAKAGNASGPGGGWVGTPLEPGNLGAWIETGTHLLSIAPTGQFEGVAMIEQSRRNDLRPGTRVTLMCEAHPGRTFRGSVVAIAERHSDSIPKALSARFGGALPTVSLPDGREEMRGAAFAGTIRIEGPTEGLLPGMRGRARFTYSGRTAAEWIAWHIQDTIRLRL